LQRADNPIRVLRHGGMRFTVERAGVGAGRQDRRPQRSIRSLRRFGGRWSVEAAKMAIEDFGGSVLGEKIELIKASRPRRSDESIAGRGDHLRLRSDRRKSSERRAGGRRISRGDIAISLQGAPDFLGPLPLPRLQSGSGALRARPLACPDETRVALTTGDQPGRSHIRPMVDCQRCQGARWVCENHPDNPWGHDERRSRHAMPRLQRAARWRAAGPARYFVPMLDRDKGPVH
jgi:hypothetical protein